MLHWDCLVLSHLGQFLAPSALLAEMETFPSILLPLPGSCSHHPDAALTCQVQHLGMHAALPNTQSPSLNNCNKLTAVPFAYYFLRMQPWDNHCHWHHLLHPPLPMIVRLVFPVVPTLPLLHFNLLSHLTGSPVSQLAKRSPSLHGLRNHNK